MTLEHLWATWRHEYVSDVARRSQTPEDAVHDVSGQACVFCRILAEGGPAATNGIVWRDEHAAVVLNAYPYASGHVLVMPVRHVDEIGALTAEESAAVWEAVRHSVDTIGRAYDPDGLNMGANLGRAAGAGIPRHLHLHVLPRFDGDTNFMTAVAGVRVMPEALAVTWERLHAAWEP